MKKFFNLLGLDIYQVFLHPSEIFFLIVCDFLFFVPAYVFCLIYPDFTGQIVAGFFLTSLFVNSIISLPLFIKREQKNGWIMQLACAGIQPQNYYLIKFFTGFIQQLFAPALYLGVTFYLLEMSYMWLIATGSFLFLILTGITVVGLINLAITPPQDYILFIILSLPLFVPLFLCGYLLLCEAYLGFEDYPWAWLHWLLSYDLIMLFTGWFFSEFLWEEFL